MATTKVNTEFIAVNAISGTIIADNAITATHIATNAISGTLVQNGGIVTTMIAANNITSTKIVTDAVLTRHIADDQVTEAKLANAINTSIAAKLPLAGGTMTGTIAGFTSTGIDDNADATAITIDSSENVTITGDLIVTGGQINTGNTAGDHSEFGTDGSGHTFIDASTSGGVMKFQTAGTDRHQIGSTGKASWSAGGAGTVTTQSRDFTFYTEGGSNGVDIRSNDYQIAFIGGAGSSGAGMDKGYMQLCVDGSAKVVFNTDGASYFNGGNVGIGTDNPSAKVHLYDSGSGNINLGIQNSTRYYKFEVDSGNLVFFDVSAYAERMRITSSGQVLVGVTSATSMSGAGIETAGSIRANNYITSTDLAGSGFRNVNTTSSGSLTTSTSLRELKENIVTTSLGLDAVKALTPREFDWKDVAEYGTEDIGFIADEVFAVSPKLATYKVGEKTEANLQGVKYEQLTAVLVKAIQEQQTIIEDLKARIETLEG